MIRLVFPMRLRPVTTVNREFSSNESFWILFNSSSSSVRL